MKTSEVIEMAMTDRSYLSNDPGSIPYLCNVLNNLVLRGKLQPEDANRTKHRIKLKLNGRETLRGYLQFMESMYSIEYRNAAMKFWTKFVRELKSEEAKHP